MSSHGSAAVTTSLLTVLCVALVHRDRPDWLAIGVGDAARAAALSPERVSRLASRVANPFADIVDTRECADHVVEVLRVLLRGCPGIQTLTDQGTPYMAAATTRALDELHAEHAPQKEGNPTLRRGKSACPR